MDFDVPSPKRQRLESEPVSIANDLTDLHDIRPGIPPSCDASLRVEQVKTPEAALDSTNTIALVSEALTNREANENGDTGATTVEMTVPAAYEGKTINTEDATTDPATRAQPLSAQEDPHLQSSPSSPNTGNAGIADQTTFMNDNMQVETTMKKATFQEVPETKEFDAEAEFEIDSSPIESSDSDSSEASSSSEDSVDDGYEMLDAEEQARRLMAEDGGSDDEGDGKSHKIPGPLRTVNEKPDEVVPKPDITVTEDMKIEDLGCVESVVENLILIKARTSGEYQVLELGSVLCLDDRTVIGVVAETLGRVQQPYYSVRFTNATAIFEAGISKDTRIYFVSQHSTYVFTQPLKAVKGSDASNIYDEEVAGDDIEFSDDEAEREYKQQLKFQKQARRDGREGDRDGYSRGPRGSRARGRGAGRARGPSHAFDNGQPSVPHRPPGQEAPLNYDDVINPALETKSEIKPESDDLYTPLKRPTNLYGMPGSQGPPMQTHMNHIQASRGNFNRGRGSNGRGSYVGGGQSRGGHSQSNGFQHPPASNSFQQPLQQSHPSQPQSSMHHNVQRPRAHVKREENAYNPTYLPENQGRLQAAPQTYQQNPYGGQPIYQTQPYPNYNQAHNYQNFNQQPSIHPPYNIPPGAHINPAFFQQQQQANNAYQPPWPQWPGQGNAYGNQR